MCRGGGGTKMQELIYQIMPYKWGLRGKSRQISSCSSSHTDVSYFFNYFFRHVFSHVRFCFVTCKQGARWFPSSMDVAELLCIQLSIGALSHQQSCTQCHLVWWCSHSCFSSLLSRWCPTLCKQYGTISYLVSIQLIQCLWCSFHIYLTYILFRCASISCIRVGGQ